MVKIIYKENSGKMNILGIKPSLYSTNCSCLQKHNRVNNGSKSLTCDTICFTGASNSLTTKDIKELFQDTSFKDWKKAKKGYTKISRIREYKHPEYGKIKVGLSLDSRLNEPFRDIYKPKAFIEAPKMNYKFITVDEQNFLWEFVTKVIGRNAVDELKQKGEIEKKRAFNNYNKLIEIANSNSTRKIKNINYVA